MTSDWVSTRLGDITFWMSGGTPRKENPEYWGGDIPWISANSMYTTRIEKSELAITRLGLENGSRLAPKGSILLLVRGGALHTRIPLGIAMRDVAFNQDVKAIIADEKIIDSWFLLSWFLANTNKLLEMVEFTGIGAGKFDTTRLQNLNVRVPPKAEQFRILSLAKSIDDKIEINRQMNATLEAMAQALFKSWFVDFDFPGFDGKLVDGLPQDWKKMKLEELIDTVSVTHTFPKDQIIFLNTSDIHDGQVLHERYSEVSSLPGQAKKTIKKNDILFSEIRPANKRHAFISFDAENYVVSTKLMVLRAKSFVDPVAIYHYLKRDEVVSWLQILAESRSGTFPQITFQQLKSLEMIVPDKKWLKLYTDNLKALFEKVRTNHKENNKLSEVRDALLPKLISGQLRIPEEERLAEAAM